MFPLSEAHFPCIPTKSGDVALSEISQDHGLAVQQRYFGILTVVAVSVFSRSSGTLECWNALHCTTCGQLNIFGCRVKHFLETL